MLKEKIIAWIRLSRPPIMLLCCFGAVVGALNSAVFLDVNLSYFQIVSAIITQLEYRQEYLFFRVCQTWEYWDFKIFYLGTAA